MLRKLFFILFIIVLFTIVTLYFEDRVRMRADEKNEQSRSSPEFEQPVNANPSDIVHSKVRMADDRTTAFCFSYTRTFSNEPSLICSIT